MCILLTEIGVWNTPFYWQQRNKSYGNRYHFIYDKKLLFYSECYIVVTSWVMSENTVNKIILGISDMDFQVYSFVLVCNKDALIDRWKKDITTEWRMMRIKQ